MRFHTPKTLKPVAGWVINKQRFDYTIFVKRCHHEGIGETPLEDKEKTHRFSPKRKTAFQ
jgi:hypothetical protein